MKHRCYNNNLSLLPTKHFFFQNLETLFIREYYLFTIEIRFRNVK